MFELADRLIGIYKTDNCTKSVCINPRIISLPSDKDSHALGGAGTGELDVENIQPPVGTTAAG